MRRIASILFFLGFWLISNCEVIINEVFYDAIGCDDGKEWIELYNNSSEDVNLQGWILQAGGINFSDIYIFPSILIRAGSFFLISESPLPLTNIQTELGFENGGSATDGIRIINPVIHHSDTILYDVPNSNNLSGDNINQAPCPGVNPGYSLARSVDGLDTDSAEDWIPCINSSPGTTNNPQKIVTLHNCQAIVNGANIDISTVILNLSTSQVDKSELSIKIVFNNELKYLEDLPCLTGLDSVRYDIAIRNEYYESGILEVEIINNSNIQIVDNLWKTWINYEIPALALSEVMYYPLSYQTEWIELKLLSDIAESELTILDASGNESTSVITGVSGDYIVIAEDKNNLLNTFGRCDSLKTFQANGWGRLNNTGDMVMIKYNDSLLDSLMYENNSTIQGCSLEYCEITDTWHRSNAEVGATPTEINSSSQISNPNSVSGLKIVNNLISIKRDKVFVVNFNLQKVVNSLELQLFDIRGKELNTINACFSGQYAGEYTWNGYLQGKYLPSGLYPTIIKIKAESGRILEEKKTIITINR